MAKSIYRINATVATAVAQGGTFTVNYPEGTNSGTFQGGYEHLLWSSGLQRLFKFPNDFSLTFGSSNITVTYLGATTIPAGSQVQLQADVIGEKGVTDYTGEVVNLTFGTIVRVDLGAPDAADADGVCESQSITADDGGDLDGALVDGGVAVFDVPRNVVAAWTGTAVLTVTGTDVYGETVVESSASGTSFTGKKAFKTVTGVSVSANVTAATVGTGDVLGLPVYLPQTGFVVKEMEDGATATAGTLVAASTAKQTATTGDVRGTYDPNSAADGLKAFSLIAFIPDPSYRGAAQYAG